MEENEENKQEITIISQVELETVSRLTEGIRNDLKTAAQSLIRACINIAKVRDGKLYKALGCKNFEDYCENKIGITRQQGGKYATIGKAFGQNGKSTFHFENIKGVNGFIRAISHNVEKLYLMAKTSEDIREEVAKAVDINDITVKELKSKISELERQYRDISDKLEKTEKNISEQVKSVEKNVGEIVRETIKSQPAPPESPAPENAPAKPTFILHSKYLSFVQRFSDAEAGELFKAIMLYTNNLPAPKLSKGVDVAFSLIIDQLDKDYEKWLAEIEKRKEAANKRWEKEKEAEISNNANECKSMQVHTDNDIDSVNVSENENIDVNEIINYLNEKAGTNFKRSSKSTQRHIKARISEGFSKNDFFKVIDSKCTDWKGTDYQKYLRPETLFGTKFEGYLNARKDNSPENTGEYDESIWGEMI